MATAEKTKEQLEAEAFAAEQERLRVLREAQSAHARTNHLEKLARRDPTVRDFLEEQSALVGLLKLTREQLTAARELAESQAADLAAARGQLAEIRTVLAQAQKDLADRAVELEQVRAGLADRTAELVTAREQLAAEQAKVTAQAAELVTQREQLAAALKPKR